MSYWLNSVDALATDASDRLTVNHIERAAVYRDSSRISNSSFNHSHTGWSRNKPACPPNCHCQTQTLICAADRQWVLGVKTFSASGCSRQENRNGWEQKLFFLIFILWHVV